MGLSPGEARPTMSARDSRFGASSPRSGRGKAAGAVIACAVMLLAGCGGSGGSAADASTGAATPIIRGDAPADPVAGEVPVANSGSAGYWSRPGWFCLDSTSYVNLLLILSSSPGWSGDTSGCVPAPNAPPAPTVVAGTAKVTATVTSGTSGGIPSAYTVTAYTATGMLTVALFDDGGVMGCDDVGGFWNAPPGVSAGRSSSW